MADIQVTAEYGDIKKLDAELKKVAASSRVLQTQFQKTAQTNDILNRTAIEGTRGLNQYGQVFNGTGRNLNRFNMQLQQVGYQVGDFAVQIQGGTNAMVALGQQGSQLLSVFGGAAGAIAGAGLAIATSFLAPIMKMQQEIANAEKLMSALSNAASDYTDAIEASAAGTDELNTKFGVFGQTAKGVLGTLLEIKRIKFEEAISAVANVAGIADPSRMLGRQVTGAQMQTLLKLMPELNKLRGGARGEAIAGFATLLGQLQEAKGAENQLKAAQALRKEFTGIVGTYEQMDAKQREFYEALVQAENNILSVVESNKAKQTAAENARIAEEQAGLQMMLDQYMTNYEADLALGQAALAEHQRQQKEKRDAEKALSDQRIEDAGREGKVFADLYVGVQENLMAVAEKQEKAFSKFLDDVKQAGGDVEKLSQVDVASGINAAAIQASNLSDKMKSALMAALGLVGLAKDVTSLDPFGGEGDTFYSTARTVYPDWASGEKKNRGGAKKETVDEYLKSLMEEAEYKQKLVGMSEEETRIQEIIFQAKQRDFVVTQEQAAAIAAVEEQTRKLIDAEQKRKSMMEAIEGHITNGFMAMIDGSSSVENAFKGMLRNILLEIYRQQVAKPAAEGIMGFFSKLFSANGNVFMNGAHVKAFADGGVVNGTTAFPMRGGVGIMGEAGPEAIMPLKRGPNGKLGVEASGGQQVVVNQSFNFAANGDESVKKIIAQAAPQIAQMTQKQIMDSRRRGGQMKAAFS